MKHSDEATTSCGATCTKPCMHTPMLTATNPSRKESINEASMHMDIDIKTPVSAVKAKEAIVTEQMLNVSFQQASLSESLKIDEETC